MTQSLLTVIFLVALLFGCHTIKGVPKCVQTKVADFDEDASCKDIRVDQYKFQGQTVYVFEPGTCGADMTSEVISEDCKTLGYLGGFVGNTKINGEEFSNAKFIKTVWKK